MKTEKAQIRSHLSATRLAMSGEERQAKGAMISENLTDLIDWSAVRFLHYFEPLMSLGEADISGFVTDLCKHHLAIEAFTSRKFDDVWKVVPTDAEQPVAAPSFDVIIVPMLGFDPKLLNRIGYGGGYYDRFLAAQPQAQKIGVCFELGKTENLPAEDHDIPLDLIVTESETYKR